MNGELLDFSEFLPTPPPDPRDTRGHAVRQKHDAYVETVLETGNYAEAARRHGYKTERLPPSPYLRRTLAERRAQYAKQYEITPSNVLKEYARMAFFDLRNLTDDDGNPVDIQDLDDDTAAALAGVEIMKLGKNDDFAQVLKYKTPDKQRALDAISKNLGLFEKDNDQKKPDAQAMDAMSANEVARRLAFWLQETMRKQGGDGANKEAQAAE